MVGQEFDKLQDGYTDKISRWVPYYHDLIGSLCSTLPGDFKPLNILDLGSGNGNVSWLLSTAYPESNMLLMDASAEMIRACRDRFGESSRFIYMEKYFQDANFMAESFDLITAGLSLHHLEAPDKQRLFQNSYEWLNPGGIFTATDLYVNKNHPEHENVLLEWERVSAEQGTTPEEWTYLMDHYRTYDRPDSFEDQIEWLKAAGFEKVKISWVKGNWGTIQAYK